VARVLLAGGGTAGHITPCVAVQEALAERQGGVEFHFAAANRPADRSLLERLSLPHSPIDAAPFPYRPSLALLRALAALRRARGQARALIGELRPDAVFSTGGYVSAAVVPEAARAHVPVVLHAADAMPGRANVALAKHADAITLAYQQSASRFGNRPTVWTGQPVRRCVRSASRDEGRKQLGISQDATVIVVIGGSQGADSINRALLETLPQLLTIRNLQIVHFTGTAHIERIRADTAQLSAAEGSAYHCHGFLDDPGDAYAAADLVVSRCGSSSMAEITTVGAPCIAIPYPHAGGHQRLNAQPLLDSGAAVLLEDEHLSGGTLGGWIVRLLGDPERLSQMAQASRDIAKPEAADSIADLILARMPGAKS
jgi:UDP-N-acetylglucosamine--N-acetylmuramyl-(pentapeptide) pyrophosphoryl-undecaprenol N-acetylglucosamine transferase